MTFINDIYQSKSMQIDDIENEVRMLRYTTDGNWREVSTLTI